MLPFFKNNATTKDDSLFHEKGIIDVTNFDASTPEDSLGYLCGCDIFIFKDGLIIINSDDNMDVLEKIFILDIIRANDNINNSTFPPA